MASNVFSFLVRQVWPPLYIKLDIWKFLHVLAGRSLPTPDPGHSFQFEDVDQQAKLLLIR